MTDGPTIIATDESMFRIVRIVNGERVTYVLEKADGCDALGVERWRELRVGEADNVTRHLRDWIIRQAIKETHEAE